ncbi:DUF3231 family protein [Paenibacillus sp. NPDC057934]|uniref:DUF3231 family protein n=1 Tax=Paenibacillus sp. NPDC057934 TaxID=3346282 RepID=UPI0036DB95F8
MAGILGGNPKDEPMHYGEIFNVWMSSTAAKGLVSLYRAFQSHAGDDDLKKVLGDLINQSELESSECDALLGTVGIASVPTLPDRPEVKVEDIPAGARFTDMEIASKIAADNAAGLVGCSTIMGMSIREDIGALFAKYHLTKAAIGIKILHMNKKKGWLIPPPLHIKG